MISKEEFFQITRSTFRGELKDAYHLNQFLCLLQRIHHPQSKNHEDSVFKGFILHNHAYVIHYPTFFRENKEALVNCFFDGNLPKNLKSPPPGILPITALYATFLERINQVSRYLTLPLSYYDSLSAYRSQLYRRLELRLESAVTAEQRSNAILSDPVDFIVIKQFTGYEIEHTRYSVKSLKNIVNTAVRIFYEPKEAYFDDNVDRNLAPIPRAILHAWRAISQRHNDPHSVVTAGLEYTPSGYLAIDWDKFTRSPYFPRDLHWKSEYYESLCIFPDSLETKHNKRRWLVRNSVLPDITGKSCRATNKFYLDLCESINVHVFPDDLRQPRISFFNIARMQSRRCNFDGAMQLRIKERQLNHLPRRHGGNFLNNHYLPRLYSFDHSYAEFCASNPKAWCKKPGAVYSISTKAGRYFSLPIAFLLLLKEYNEPTGKFPEEIMQLFRQELELLRICLEGVYLSLDTQAVGRGAYWESYLLEQASQGNESNNFPHAHTQRPRGRLAQMRAQAQANRDSGIVTPYVHFSFVSRKTYTQVFEDAYETMQRIFSSELIARDIKLQRKMGLDNRNEVALPSIRMPLSSVSGTPGSDETTADYFPDLVNSATNAKVLELLSIPIDSVLQSVRQRNKVLKLMREVVQGETLEPMERNGVTYLWNRIRHHMAESRGRILHRSSLVKSWNQPNPFYVDFFSPFVLTLIKTYSAIAMDKAEGRSIAGVDVQMQKLLANITQGGHLLNAWATDCLRIEELPDKAYSKLRVDIENPRQHAPSVWLPEHDFILLQSVGKRPAPPRERQLSLRSQLPQYKADQCALRTRIETVRSLIKDNVSESFYIKNLQQISMHLWQNAAWAKKYVLIFGVFKAVMRQDHSTVLSISLAEEIALAIMKLKDEFVLELPLPETYKSPYFDNYLFKGRFDLPGKDVGAESRHAHRARFKVPSLIPDFSIGSNMGLAEEIIKSKARRFPG